MSDKRRRTSIPAIRYVATQIMGGCLFVGLAWLAIQFEPGEAYIRSQFDSETVTSAWLSDTPVTNWLSNRAMHVWANEPSRSSWLPTFGVKQTKEDQYASGWFAPLSQATVQQTFKQTGKGIVLQAKQPTEIQAIGDGEVIFCAPPEKNGIGWTVVIAHKDEAKSIYGMLEQTSVRVGDTVIGGQSIGWISEEEREAPSTLYFAFKQGALFLDPEAVIGFD